MLYNSKVCFDIGWSKPSFARHTRTEWLNKLIAINTVSFNTREYILGFMKIKRI